MDSINRPKPHPPIKKVVEVDISTNKQENTPATPVETSTESKAPAKKPYVFKEHLTERPFKNHDGLQKLKESITTEEPRPRYLGERPRSASRSKRSK